MSYQSTRKRSAWNFFLKTKCSELKLQNPDAHLNDLSIMAGKIWKNMSQAERKKYEEMSIDDKIKRDREEVEKIIKRRDQLSFNHKNIDQNDIPITPYYQFMVEMLDEIKKKETMMNYEQKCEAISTLWNEMSEKEKKSYQNNKTAITENILKRSKNCAINGIDFDDLDLFREFDEI